MMPSSRCTRHLSGLLMRAQPLFNQFIVQTPGSCRITVMHCCCDNIAIDLENYILELIPTLPQLDGLEKSFYSFYVCTAVRKFFFFLDPLRTGQYLNLDKDHNGMLSKEELSRYGTATLTSVFLDRVFQECLTYDGEMDEIFDMVKPKDPYKITLQDLVNSCQGDTVVSILIDLNGFWTYENREMLVANDDSSNTVDLDET
ncbi:hypothetical protein GOODEAATRI_005674 [Goodea atripinnis]|uniref:Uncharacterized protein n=1 Tax=Goodea atripinnis TaxID=208336 RepID=A0ABV0MZ04_9TELE